jgi:GntR family transcriptional regulator, transcriptional repressor for pyruvate dehydrogenase complex
MPAYPSDPTAELGAPLSPIPAKTPTAAVASQLLSYFTSGGLLPGSRLPAERQLAEMLGTGRSAVREALAALEILGVVTVRPGSGTYLQAGVSELLPRTLSWGLMLGGQRTQDLVEIRGALEVLAVRRAAEHVDEDAVSRLREHIDVMRENINDHETFVEADVRFHQELATAAGNDALAVLLQSVRSLLRVWVDRSVDNTADARRAVIEHERVLHAIEARDPDRAVSSMSEHMATAGDRLMRLVETPVP